MRANVARNHPRDPTVEQTDSGSQVHKSQINQKAARRTRELLQSAKGAGSFCCCCSDSGIQTSWQPTRCPADPIRSEPSRAVCRFWTVRQRVAQLRLLIYTRPGILAAAAAAASAPVSLPLPLPTSEVQRSRRAVAWKFIYFRAMIWQYFNIQRCNRISF